MRVDRFGGVDHKIEAQRVAEKGRQRTWARQRPSRSISLRTWEAGMQGESSVEG